MKKNFFSLTAATLILFTSCKKETEESVLGQMVNVQETAPISQAASYKMILTGTWQSPSHTVPAANHFTKFNGMIHSSSSALFTLGGFATLGVENVAEVGNDTELLNEINSYISSAKAMSKFSMSLATITSSDSITVSVTKEHSLISFESMIAPSPDWFAGLDSYNLIQNGKWVNDITVNIYGYDAGTEDGDVFAYNNPATLPQQPVRFLTPGNASVIANGNSSVAPFAVLRLVKL